MGNLLIELQHFICLNSGVISIIVGLIGIWITLIIHRRTKFLRDFIEREGVIKYVFEEISSLLDNIYDDEPINITLSKLSKIENIITYLKEKDISDDNKYIYNLLKNYHSQLIKVFEEKEKLEKALQQLENTAI